MRKKAGLIILLITIIVISACTQNDVVKLGFLGDLSGSSSFLSRSGLQGGQIALDEFNDSGGSNGALVEFVIKDNSGVLENNKELLYEFEKEDVEVVIGPYISEMIVPAVDDVNARDLLLISPTVSSGEISGQDDNIIRVIAELNKQGEILADLAIKNEDNKILVIYNEMNKSFTKALVDSFARTYTKNGGQVVNTIKYSEIIEEIDVLMEAMKAEEFDGIMFLGNGFDTAFLAQNLNKHALDKQLYLSLWSNTKDLIEEGGNAINGAYILDFFDSESSSEDYNLFKEKYIEKYGEEPTFSSVFTYESTKLYLESIRAVGYEDWKKIKRYIINNGQVNGLQNTFEIDLYGDSNRDYLPYQIDSGKYKLIE